MNEHLERLVEMVAHSSVTGLTVQTPSLRVTIRRPAAPAHAASAAPHESAGPAEPLEAPPGPATDAAPLGERIRSPRVGVFHFTEPRVAVGEVVEAGQTVGVVESMKLMNEVRAPRTALVMEVLVEEGAGVEYDQPLFVLWERLEDAA